MKKRLFFMLALCISFAIAHAQSVKIQGKITEKNGDPIAGAVVSLKSNAQRATTTDLKGEFALTIPTANEIIVIHALGHKDVEMNTAGSAFITASLETDASAGGMDEVIVVGVAVKKKDLTGAVSSIDSKEIEKTPTSSINQAIQGKVPGARIVASPQPGADASIKIRGNNSLQYGTNPIYVVDGTILESNFNTLNPDDIESVQVLKDASATAIYGSRGANGVVLVTTKKGKRGAGRISFDTWIGSQWFSKKMDIMNAHDIYNLRVDAYANAYMENNPNGDRQAYINSITGDNSTVFAKYEQDTYRAGLSYDWLKPVQQSGLQQNYNLGFSGGSDKGTYFVSLNYTDQEGLIKTSAYQRFSGRINLEQNVKSWLKVGTNTTFAYSKSSVPSGDVFNGAINANPLLPVNDSMQQIMWANTPDQNIYNPIKSLSIISNNNLSRLITSNYVSITPVKHVTIRSTLAANLMWQQNYGYTPIGVGQDTRNSYHGSASHYKAETSSWQWDNTASYSNSFGKSTLNAMVGTSLQMTNQNSDQFNVYGFPNNSLTYYNIGSAYSRAIFAPSSNFVTSTLVSYLGRADYAYENKYFATATVRFDGSSKFTSSDRWGAFPSLALGWDMSKENFMQDLHWLNKLKWRAGYGIAGNQNIPNLAYYSIYVPYYTNNQIVFQSDGGRGNPNLTWEKQKQFNVGADITLLNNRLNVSADYFHTVNDDLLMTRTLPATSGYKREVANVGAMTNNGFELNINYTAIQNKDWQWNIMFNISADKNKITKLYAQVPAIFNKGGFTGVEIQRTGNYILGESVNSVYSWKFKKIAQQSDMKDTVGMNYFGRTVHPGDIMVEDVNGDKKIDDNDKGVVGKLDPKFYGGFGTDLNYKGFGLNLFFNYSYGLKRISGFYEGMIQSWGNTISHNDMNGRWTPENQSTKFPRALTQLGNINRFNPGDSDWGLQNASFLRLSTATLSYSMPASLMKQLSMETARIYVTGTNLLLFTKDKGYDPETGDGFPNFKQVVVGLNIGL
ncbi:TonB-dependent receptor [Chitinophagaceae bacterium 26-R-25]|nr:TonB-dependent receptor [Chitinophagaceae bacterium 26-R-25]